MTRPLILVAAVALAFTQDVSAQNQANRRPARTDAPSAGDAAANPEAKAGYDAFANVKMKNIFDPTRRGVARADGPSAAAAANAAQVKRGRSLALTGTMVTEGKALAFFGGSAAEGTRVVPLGSSVASYKVVSIAPTQVSLEHEGKSVLLDVGRQITFEGGSGDAPAPEPVIEKAAEPAVDATGAPVLPPAAGDKAEILRRMMERRAKEGAK